jgi:hypothetical protein
MGAKRGTPEERFWRFVGKSTDGHWYWLGCVSGVGYGQLNVGNRVRKSAHRLSFEMHKGEVPDGMFVCHTCDIRHCVNPDHLFAGTALDNTRDMMAKGRWEMNGPRKMPRGSQHSRAKLTEAQVVEIRRRRSNGETLVSIARSFGVTIAAIWYITTGKNWSWL